MVIMVKSNTVCINEKLDERFRNCISKAYPQKRGNRKRAAEEAVTDWCEKVEKRA
jgi:hypothetical protein